MKQRWTKLLFLSLPFLAACTGAIPSRSSDSDDDVGGGDDAPPTMRGGSGGAMTGAGGQGAIGPTAPPGSPERLVPGGAFRRLAMRELEATLDDLFPELAATRPHFPPDSFYLFDNDLAELDAGLAFSENVGVVAQELVVLARKTPAVWTRVRTCGASMDKAACVGSLYDQWAPKLLRRPGTSGERARFLALAGLDLGTVDDVLAVALEALLRHPELVHRVELGEGAGDKRLLAEHEILSRMAFFLWGRAPDDGLRMAAAGLSLRAQADRLTLAKRMLDDARARTQVVEEHAQWLGYAKMTRDALGQAMWKESAALIEKVVFQDNADYRQLYLTRESYLAPTLATHYGLPAVAKEGWTPYASPNRRGILSHGTFLSAFANVADTSISKRGKAVHNRLLCRTIELPPQSDIDVDVMPGDNECRVDFFRESHAGGSCAACHKQLDGVGFGLERFDRRGAPRTHELGKPGCALDGKGQLDGRAFEGPAGLAEVVTEHESFQPCVVQQAVRFYLGRDPARSDEGTAWVEELARQVAGDRFRFHDLILAIVGSGEFVQVAPQVVDSVGGKP